MATGARVSSIILDSIHVKQSILESDALLGRIDRFVAILIEAFRQNKKVLFCGNGGSAADAQHIAAELSGRFYLDRKGLYAEALHCNSSYLTAISNDYSFDIVYARMVEAMGEEGDILVAISTSGNSKNIVLAAEMARKKGMQTICMTGETGGELGSLCDLLINMPSKVTPRIQESHILIGHIVCELVEEAIFGK